MGEISAEAVAAFVAALALVATTASVFYLARQTKAGERNSVARRTDDLDGCLMRPRTRDRTMPDPLHPDERPDLAGWRRRHAQRSSNAARPIPSGKQYRRKQKHPLRQDPGAQR
ncbi:hypothetical protein [Nocardia sp. NBC_01329]|uniref:hypothetical protein n=1 Tax=Nocardia sp. NBC_01329 TaxID=2903594 RepID=UPI002E15BD91|nr:hypothetical protein OG405_08005 [Nocardia sp. NBC_01329]